MNTLTKETMEKVEICLRENEEAYSIEWAGDYCRTFDENGDVIDDFMIDIDEDDVTCVTSMKNWQVTLPIE